MRYYVLVCKQLRNLQTPVLLGVCIYKIHQLVPAIKFVRWCHPVCVDYSSTLFDKTISYCCTAHLKILYASHPSPAAPATTPPAMAIAGPPATAATVVVLAMNIFAIMPPPTPPTMAPPSVPTSFLKSLRPPPCVEQGIADIL